MRKPSTMPWWLVATMAVVLTVTSGRSHGEAPTPFDVVEQSIPELQEAMKSGKVTSRQLVEAYLARIRAYDQAGPRIGAMLAINPKALDAAAALDEERRTKGARGILHGIPIVVKDNYATEDMPATGGSKALAGFETHRDAFMVKKLRDAGVVLLGKTNLHELAYGITTVSSLGGQTRNPYDIMRNPGGSSGGTGAAVAASFAAAGLGTDTCGSIRIPAAHNNLVGLRGTMGLSSRDGIIPLSLTQDIGGPLARSTTDLAVMLDATVGLDPSDAVTGASRGQIPLTYLSAMGDSSLGDIRVGVVSSLFGVAPEDGEVGTIVRDALATLRQMGAGVEELAMPELDGLLSLTSVITAEFKFNLMDFLARYPDAPVHSLGQILERGACDPAVENVFRRANEVDTRDSAGYRAARQKREAARQSITSTMRLRGLTALAYPSLRRKPAPIGQGQAGSNCQLNATTGLPAIAMPAGFTTDGLPVGFELLGAAFSEPTLLRVAYAYERVASPRRKPKNTP